MRWGGVGGWGVGGVGWVGVYQRCSLQTKEHTHAHTHTQRNAVSKTSSTFFEHGSPELPGRGDAGPEPRGSAGPVQEGDEARKNPPRRGASFRGRGKARRRGVFFWPGVRFKAGSGGSGVVWCRPGVRFKEGSGGSGVSLVQARCKVQGRFRRFRGESGAGQV